MVIDRALLKMPLIGILLRKIAVARFTRTLGTLISSGVPILEGLDITARSSGNAVVEKALHADSQSNWKLDARLPIRSSETEVFPGMVTQMIAVGEQTGAMDAMLQKIADFYEDEVDSAVKDLLTALEPVMIVFLGVVVGGMVISMYLPLFVDRQTIRALERNQTLPESIDAWFPEAGLKGRRIDRQLLRKSDGLCPSGISTSRLLPRFQRSQHNEGMPGIERRQNERVDRLA